MSDADSQRFDPSLGTRPPAGMHDLLSPRVDSPQLAQPTFFRPYSIGHHAIHPTVGDRRSGMDNSLIQQTTFGSGLTNGPPAGQLPPFTPARSSRALSTGPDASWSPAVPASSLSPVHEGTLGSHLSNNSEASLVTPPVQQRPDVDAVLPGRFVNGLVSKYELDEESAGYLRGHIMLGSVGEKLSIPDLATRADAYAAALSVRKDIREVKKIAQQIIEVKAKVEVIESRLSKTGLELDGVVRLLIRKKIREYIFHIRCVHPRNIQKDFVNDLKKNTALQKELGVERIIKHKTAETHLTRHIGKQCSYIRDKLRTNFVDSVLADTFKTLDEFTEYCAEKWLGVNAATVDPVYKYRNAIIRHFLVSHPELLRTSDDGDRDSDDEDEENSTPAQANGKSSTNVVKGHFWKRVGKYLEGLFKQFGDSLLDERWQPTIQEALKHEADNYSQLRQQVTAGGQPLSSTQQQTSELENLTASDERYLVGVLNDVI
ncbi:hypothetical protein PQX77_001157, partial [Marasmius sp. AFHP31]